MSLKTEDVFYLHDRYRTLAENREEVVAGIRRDGWRVVGIIALVYGTLMFLFILQRNFMPMSTGGFSNIILLQVIVMLMAILLLSIPYRRQAHLFAEGEILKGTIDAVTTRKNQSRQEVTIEYHFQTMFGETLKGAIGTIILSQNPGRFVTTMTYHTQIISNGISFGRQVCWLDNTDGKGLPEVGMTVAVLYRTNKHYMVL